MACLTCPSDKIFARGYCQRCYRNNRASGALARINVQNTGACTAEGCDNPAFAKNLCKLHYDRAEHPLKHTWKLLRSRARGDYPPSWDRFETFLADIGNRPTPIHQLRRNDVTLPWSTTNFRWVEPIIVADEEARKRNRAYERAWRFRRKFNISIEDYDRILESQGGTCAICHNESAVTHKRSGKVRDLAVDHSHETNITRGILCTDCNTALGLLGDSPDRLRAAAAYLERHAKPSDGVALTSMAHPVGPGVGRGHRIKPSSLVTETVMVDTETGEMRLVQPPVA
jgi:hypothetical protein